MFASLKNKIKEETGSDVAKLRLGEQRNNRESETERLERKLREKERECEEKTSSLVGAQVVWSEEAAAARREVRDLVRRNSALSERLEAATAAAARAQDRLDSLMESVETERREWALERLRLAETAQDALHGLSLAQVGGARSHPDDMEAELKRKLEETQLHLHDVKTSWSGRIAALETQVGRLSRQAGEESAERRRVEKENETLLRRFKEKESQLEQALSTLQDKEAKDSSERNSREADQETQNFRKKWETASVENNRLSRRLDTMKNEMEALLGLESNRSESADLSQRITDFGETIRELQRDHRDLGEKYEKQRRENDETLMRNAHMSQTLEIYRRELRQRESEITELKNKLSSPENERESVKQMVEEKERHQKEVEDLKSERDSTLTQLQECVKNLNGQLSEKSKSIRVLQNKLADMRKTLQKEFKGGQTECLSGTAVENATEDQEISKKYLKHVLIKFLTSRDIEARQLTKAVGALLDLSEQEETLLRDSLTWRNGLSAWLTPVPRFSNS